MENYDWKWSFFLFWMQKRINVDVLTASNTHVKLIETRTVHNFCKTKIVVLFWENEHTWPRLIVLAKFITCLPHWIRNHVTLLFPINPKARAKIKWRISWITAINRANRQLHDGVILLLWPESFRVLLSCANEGFCYLNLTGATKFKYEREKEKNSGRSSKMTPSCKWPIAETSVTIENSPIKVYTHVSRTIRTHLLKVWLQGSVLFPC